jgi:3-isopropylmalate/(R)-2-methylmalate dehydratase small subunit
MAREPFGVVRSAAVPLLRDDVDTDQIIPARYLKGTSREGMAAGLFADWRYAADGSPRPEFVLNQPEMAGRQVLLVGDNFGCGSSREHATWALAGWGIRAVVARGFADIFRNNALKVGLLPVPLTPEDHAAVAAAVAIDPTLELTVDLETEQLRLPGGIAYGFAVDPFARSMLLAGTDELGFLLSLEPEVSAFEAAHPAPVSTLPRD